MESTGNKSLDGERAYKRSSEEQHEVLSSILNNTAPPPKKAKCVDNQPHPKKNMKEVAGTVPALPIQDTPISAVPDAIRNTSSAVPRPTQPEFNKENMPIVNFSGCTNVSVKYYFKQ